MAGKAERRVRFALRSSGDCENWSTTSRVLALPRDTSSERSEVPVVHLG